jgi:hypothetical protein
MQPATHDEAPQQRMFGASIQWYNTRTSSNQLEEGKSQNRHSGIAKTVLWELSMAYLPDYRHDVFVSYADRDDDPAEGAWVSNFIELLKEKLAELLGKDCVSLWTDAGMAAGDQYTPAQATALGETAIFIIVLSPHYLASDWCPDGLEQENPIFMKLVDERSSEQDVDVYIVEKTKTSGLPEELAAAQACPFWRQTDAEPRTFHASIDDDDFLDALDDLAYKLVRELRRLRDNHPREVREDQPVVFLAEVTDDLNLLWTKAKRFLDREHVRVVPRSLRGRRTNELRDAITRDLARSHVFLQLLSASEWQPIPDLSESLPTFQHRCAEEIGISILQWRIQELEDTDIEQEVADPVQRRLLLASTPSPLEMFCREACEKARWVAKSKLVQPREGFVFVHREDPESHCVRKLCEHLRLCQLDHVFPRDRGRPDEIRRDFTTNLLATDGTIIVYDQDDDRWVKPQLMAMRRILRTSQDMAKTPKAVYEGPPVDKPDVGMWLTNMFVVNCRREFDPEELEPFFEALEKRAQRGSEDRPLMDDRDEYDVFVSHNSVDRDFAVWLYGCLRVEEIHPWLDDRQMQPGRTFLAQIQESMRKAKSIVVLIGTQGLGKWQRFEAEIGIHENVIQSDPPFLVIPVLLPGVSQLPKEEFLLNAYPFIKFRRRDDADALAKLVEAICRLKSE